MNGWKSLLLQKQCY